MTHKLRVGVSGVLVVLLLVLGYSMGLHTMLAQAAGLVFKTDCVTATATSTLTYMTKGTATTTITCAMGNDGADSAALSVILNASSTVSNLNIYVEESMDGQDWFPILPNQLASTTNPLNLNTRAYSTNTFASSTIGGGLGGANSVGVDGSNNRNHYLIDVPVRMKRVRAYAAIASTSPDLRVENAGVWMQIIPKI